MENLGEKLKSLRIDRGWTQSKMGELLSVSQDTVSLWERNKRRVRCLCRLAVGAGRGLSLPARVRAWRASHTFDRLDARSIFNAAKTHPSFVLSTSKRKRTRKRIRKHIRKHIRNHISNEDSTGQSGKLSANILSMRMLSALSKNQYFCCKIVDKPSAFLYIDSVECGEVSH